MNAPRQSKQTVENETSHAYPVSGQVFKRVRASEKTEESAPTYEPDTQVCAKKAFTSRWR